MRKGLLQVRKDRFECGTLKMPAASAGTPHISTAAPHARPFKPRALWVIASSWQTVLLGITTRGHGNVPSVIEESDMLAVASTLAKRTGKTACLSDQGDRCEPCALLLPRVTLGSVVLGFPDPFAETCLHRSCTPMPRSTFQAPSRLEIVRLGH